jgi:hypothetical protein
MVAKDFYGSYKMYTFKGSIFGLVPTIDPVFIPDANVHFLSNDYYITLILQNLHFHHQWNHSYSGSKTTAKALIYLNSYSNLTLENITISSHYTTMLTQSPVIFSHHTGNFVTIKNCIFENISFSKISLFFDNWDCLYNLQNVIIRNIKGLYF